MTLKKLTHKGLPGFTLIEILIFLFLSLAMVLVLLATASSLYQTLGVNLESTASKIAIGEIENLRNTAFSSLPSCPPPQGCPLADPSHLARLTQGSGARIITDNFGGDTKIKQVTIKISWIVGSNKQKQISINTLISENGI